MRILSIDPSVNNVGWALLDLSKPSLDDRWRWGLIKPEGRNLQRRISNTADKLDFQIPDIRNIDLFITEWPAFFGSTRGQIAAQQGYTINLAAVASYLAGFFGFANSKWSTITANEWKGTVTKAVTMRKFMRYFNGMDYDIRIGVSEHSIDAIMMMHYHVKTSFESGAKQFSKQNELPPEFYL